jgi:hypothetical protein
MTSRTVFALLLVVFVVPRAAWAHGLPMTFHVNADGNFESDASAYYGPVLDPIEQHDSVFRNTGSYTITSLNGVATPSTTASSLQFTASPGTSNPPATNGLAIGSTYGFNLVGPLVFWDPVSGITPTDVVATIVRSGAGGVYRGQEHDVRAGWFSGRRCHGSVWSLQRHNGFSQLDHGQHSARLAGRPVRRWV